MSETVFNKNLPVAIGSDHAGFDYKTIVIKMLHDAGWQVADLGTHSLESCDYPDYAHSVATMVESGKAATGILICGSGNGVSMAANKHTGIRAAVCWTEELVSLARSHNNANILCIPARFISTELALKMTNLFLSVPFEGGRHQRRVEKI
jgi:ribose 5-phosphate isomerase B